MSTTRLSDIKLSFWDKRLQKKFIKRLLSIDKSRWIGINRTFNFWSIPPEFYDLIPKWWKYNKLPRKTFAFIRPVMQIIDDVFTKEEQLRYHNVQKGKMTDAEFTFWNSMDSFGEERVSRYYDRADYMDKIEWWKDDVFEKIKTALETDTLKSN